MRVPAMRSVIERRVLVNYRVAPDVLAGMLPSPFRPLTVNGVGMAGICCIRLGQLRPAGLPSWMGLRTENAAHRIAVEWDACDGPMQGVFIPRRDTNSRLSTLVGGRLFPGEHYLARFKVSEAGDRYRIAFTSRDGSAAVDVEATLTAALPATSIFASLDEASEFFATGAIGYSARRDSAVDGVRLACEQWEVSPLNVEHVHSSFFEDRVRFPVGSTEFSTAPC